MTNLRQLTTRTHSLIPDQYVSISNEVCWDWMACWEKEIKTQKYSFYTTDDGYIIHGEESYNVFVLKIEEWWLKEYRSQLLKQGFKYIDLKDSSSWVMRDNKIPQISFVITSIGGFIPDGPFVAHQLDIFNGEKLKKTKNFKSWPLLKTYLWMEIPNA